MGAWVQFILPTLFQSVLWLEGYFREERRDEKHPPLLRALGHAWGVHAAELGLIKAGKNKGQRLENECLGAVILGQATQHHVPQHPMAGESKDWLQHPSQPKTGGGTARDYKSLMFQPC